MARIPVQAMAPFFQSCKEFWLRQVLGIDTWVDLCEEAFNPFFIPAANGRVPSINQVEFDADLVSDTLWGAF